MIKNIVKLMLGLSIPNQKINIYKTLLFNFLAFGIKGVLKCPVYIYRNTKIYSVGKINIECPWERGMIKVGELDLKSQGVTKFLNRGNIKFKGYVAIGGCTILENYGEIVFEGYNRIGDGSFILIREKFIMGEQIRLGFHCFVMDSDDHYTIDIETKKVTRNTKPIILGKYNWIASHSYIKKGVITPDYLIVASANALLTKDYSSLPPYSIIGGNPVRLLKSGIRRIYNKEEERKIKKYFLNNPDENMFVYEDAADIDKICLQRTSSF